MRTTAGRPRSRIPFKTLRFEPGAEHVWGINFGRRIRRKNEVDYWSPVPRAFTIYRASLAGNLDGLPDVAPGRNLRIKPYVLGGRGARDRRRHVRPDARRRARRQVRRHAVSLTLDVTVNPDFAQVEADEQQVNLTQFSLFFPEKREFFLENSGIFYFGDIPRNNRVNDALRPPRRTCCSSSAAGSA